MALPTLTLDDIARDATRRKHFLDAFPNEKEILELRFSFLQRVREYKALLGRPHALQTLAEEIVQIYLRHASTDLCVFQHDSLEMRSVVDRVVTTVTAKRSIPDVFHGIEAHVTERLEREHFTPFLTTNHYQQLCDTIRKHREVPLGEILVDTQRTARLAQFLEYSQPENLGNLHFWVDVQTGFLPLIQTTVVSVALFEEIQSTVRRIYNQYVTETATTTVAKMIPEAIRKDTLKRILQLQGEPFSPSKYATLFRPAQEKIWHWLQAIVYPKFQATMFYVALVVEIENLESDRQLRKLSEHVRDSAATSNPTSVPHGRLSAIVVPVNSSIHPTADTLSRIVRIIEAPQSDTSAKSYRQAIEMPAELAHIGIQAIGIIKVTDVQDDGHCCFDREFRAQTQIDGNAEQDAEYLDFMWNWRHTVLLPTVTSPSNRIATTALTQTMRRFSVPSLGLKSSPVYGFALQTWTPKQNCAKKCVDAESDSISEPTPDSNSLHTEGVHQLPRFIYLLTTQLINIEGITSGLRELAEMTSSVKATELCRCFQNAMKNASPLALPYSLAPQYTSFCCDRTLESSAFRRVNWIFKELSHQTVVTLLGALLVGKSVVIVSPRPSALMVITEALVELIKPFEWQHLVLPICPVRTACALADRAFFSTTSSFRAADHHASQPFLIGLEGELVHVKTKDSASDPRHTIRNSIYSVQRVSLQLRRPAIDHPHGLSCQDPEATTYPIEILQCPAVILDVDADDVYTPERLDVPEFPQTLVRTFELNLKDALIGRSMVKEDSRRFFKSPCEPGLFHDMLIGPNPNGKLPTTDAVQLAVLAFLESMFGDVAFYFSSFQQRSHDPAAASQPSTDTSAQSETFLIFEADLFLDAKIELGCRELFRQVFQTEMFRQYLLRQHARFCNPTQA